MNQDGKETSGNEGRKTSEILQGLSLKRIFFFQQFWIFSLRWNSPYTVPCNIKPVCPYSALS